MDADTRFRPRRAAQIEHTAPSLRSSSVVSAPRAPGPRPPAAA